MQAGKHSRAVIGALYDTPAGQQFLREARNALPDEVWLGHQRAADRTPAYDSPEIYAGLKPAL